MTKFEQALLHAAKVALHIGWSIALLTMFEYFSNHASVPAWFSNALVAYGLPLATVNVVWAGIVKWFYAEVPTTPVVDGAPVSPTTPAVTPPQA